MTNPILSIVIANYNYGRFLDQAIQSVIAQGVGDKVELIICDAASTDNSIAIIKKYANGLPPNTQYVDWQADNDQQPSSSNPRLITWWCSERDGGQSAAFNKGFSHARGDWLTWLNADDLLITGALKKFLELVDHKKDVEWVTGNMVSFDSDSGSIKHVSWGPHLHPFFLKRGHAPHAVFGPTSFFKKTLYDKMGAIDEKLHFAMDVDYWARLTMAGVLQCRLNCLCWGFRIHDESKTAGDQSNGVSESRDAECNLWHNQNHYYFVYKLTNPWYIIWMICRILDGSIFVKIVKSFKFRALKINQIVGVP